MEVEKLKGMVGEDKTVLLNKIKNEIIGSMK